MKMRPVSVGVLHVITGKSRLQQFHLNWLTWAYISVLSGAYSVDEILLGAVILIYTQSGIC
jgi:hypothetical protein